MTNFFRSKLGLWASIFAFLGLSGLQQASLSDFPPFTFGLNSAFVPFVQKCALELCIQSEANFTRGARVVSDAKEARPRELGNLGSIVLHCRKRHFQVAESIISPNR